MTLLNLFKTAARSVMTNKLRAGLTMLGIMIGVASVIVMLALGNGARAAVDANFRSLGSDEVQVSEKKVMKNGTLVSAGKTLTYEDGLNLAHDLTDLDRVDMFVSGSGRARYGRNVLDLNYTGTTADAIRSYVASGTVQPVNWPPERALTAADFLFEGRYFTPAEVLEDAPVCVLGWRTADTLFEGDDPLGNTAWINRLPCTVIGVLAELENTDPAQRYTSSVNDTFLLPIGAVVKNLFQTEPSVSIMAYVKDESQIDAVKAQITDFLRQRHAVEKDANGVYQDDFVLTTRNDILGAQQDAARTFSILLAAMAVVSLLVGGIGIMNVMLVSVTERTREIGIRLAVGAHKGDIVRQFLLEAVLISAFGGLFGIALGIFAIPLAASLNQGVALLAPNSIPLALGVALLTGILFGLYPAARASGLDPMEALRYE
jgi:ABC-type antimicrobial peptide transport system permease subunit